MPRKNFIITTRSQLLLLCSISRIIIIIIQLKLRIILHELFKMLLMEVSFPNLIWVQKSTSIILNSLTANFKYNLKALTFIIISMHTNHSRKIIMLPIHPTHFSNNYKMIKVSKLFNSRILYPSSFPLWFIFMHLNCLPIVFVKINFKLYFREYLLLNSNLIIHFKKTLSMEVFVK